MKTRTLLATSVLALYLCTVGALAQGTAFTYQGRLNLNGTPANGSYDLTFTLFQNSSGGTPGAGPLTNSATAVSNGLFTVTLDFGDVFNGSLAAPNWLEIAVRTNGAASFTTLVPRTQITPTPYSIYSENAGLAGSVGNNSVTAGDLSTAGSPVNGQILVYAGSGLMWTNPPASGGAGWLLTGNSGTTPGMDFLGTLDNEPLELWVNGLQTLTLQPGASGDPNIFVGNGSIMGAYADGSTIAGGFYNSVSAQSQSATIGGGYDNTVSNLYATVSGGEINKALANGSAIGGGYRNTASGQQSTIAGGAENVASGPGATVGGGGTDGAYFNANTASGPAATVPGGLQNTASGQYSIVGGGANNTASGEAATVGGGLDNQAQNGSDTVPGGAQNVASGGNSFAAGTFAEALHQGAFIWSDAEGTAFASTAANQFSVRANGGVRLVTGGNGATGLTLDGYEVLTTATGGGGGGGVATNAWLLTGNSGANPAHGYFLGTSDTNGLQLDVNSERGLRLDYSLSTSGGFPPVVSDSINVDGGFWGNVISNGIIGATIAGGGGETIPAQMPNTVGGNFGAVGGGEWNMAGAYATVPGGYNNHAIGMGSFAAGYNASANDNDSFVWGDGSRAALSQGSNTFAILATGGAFFYTTPGSLNVEVDPAGDVDFGSQTRQMLNLWGSSYGIGVQSSTLYQRTAAGGGFAWFAGGVHNNGQDNPGGGTTVMTLDGSGDLNVTANASVCSLTIRGGCDLAEPFQISHQDNEIAEGSVVVIDENNPGRLKLSDQPYDTHVAGVISGANGVNPGIQMHQEGMIEGGKNVSLTGRVYVQADASNGAIHPGDLLTTSASPGRAMKVTDHARAQGAILGKAMTGLRDGQGMVLVLVTLQ